MTLLLYAITARDHALPAAAVGFGGRPLRRVSTGEVAAVVGDVDATPAPTHETLLGYERTLEGLMAEGTMLPARFGTVLADDAAVEELVAGRHDAFADALRRVAGAVEMGVRAGWTDADADRRPSGAEYLRGRLAQRQRAQRVAAKLDTALGELAQDRACRIRALSQAQVTAAYLVARPQVGEFRAACAGLAASVSEATVTCTGPWPPYSFVGTEET
jgi:Gas vesicle synthesis protein GvpL/GvpF